MSQEGASEQPATPAPMPAQGSPPGGGPPPSGPPSGGPPPGGVKVGPLTVSPHVARFIGIGAVVSIAVSIAGLLANEDNLLADAWPEVLAITVGLVWAWAGINDFRAGLHRRLPTMIKGAAPRHKWSWLRPYLERVISPYAAFWAFVIPASMLLIAGSFLTGIIPQVAAAGGLFLVANMAAFLAVQRERDAFLMLAITQAVIIITNPDGIPGLVDLAS